MKLITTVVVAAFTLIAGLIPTRAEVTLDQLAAAVQAIPKSYPLQPAPGTYGIYDLRIENLCGGASSISELATAWVDGAPAVFSRRTRARSRSQ